MSPSQGNSSPMVILVFVENTLLILMPTRNSPGLSLSLTVLDDASQLVELQLE